MSNDSCFLAEHTDSLPRKGGRKHHSVVEEVASFKKKNKKNLSQIIQALKQDLCSTQSTTLMYSVATSSSMSCAFSGVDISHKDYLPVYLSGARDTAAPQGLFAHVSKWSLRCYDCSVKTNSKALSNSLLKSSLKSDVIQMLTSL